MSGEKEKKDHGKRVGEDNVKATLKADKGDQAELLSWSTEDFTQKGDNYETAVTSVKVSYQLEGKTENTSYVVKINPDHGIEMFKSFTRTVFEKEGGFYEHILPLLNEALVDAGLETLRVPKWLYSNMEENRELIFLEDLRLKGFKMYDRKKGMDLPHAMLVLGELARMHAASELLKLKKSLEDLAEEFSFLNLDWHNYPGYQKDVLNRTFSVHFETAEGILSKIEGYEKPQKWLFENKNSIEELLEKHLVRKDPFTVICHGDCWNNNFLFRYDDEGRPVEVMLVDLQFSRIASPATDLNYLLCTSVDGNVRSENEAHFLETYYSCFKSVLNAAGKPMPFDTQQLLKEYRMRHEFGLMFATMTITIMVMQSEDLPERMGEIKEEDIPRLMAKVKELVINSAQKNPLFRPRFLALYDYMIHNGVYLDN